MVFAEISGEELKSLDEVNSHGNLLNLAVLNEILCLLVKYIVKFI